MLPKTSQYSVPSGDWEVDTAYREEVNENYEQIWQKAKRSMFAFGFEESNIPTMSVTKEDRERTLERRLAERRRI